MSSTRKPQRGAAKDFYPTPPEAIEPLVKVLKFPIAPTILEPCKGTGIIIDTLAKHLPKAEFDWCEIELGKDFFDYEPDPLGVDFIITNPPFSQALAFINKSLEIADCVVMLLPHSFLGSDGRKEWWLAHKPTLQINVSHRPSFTGDGKTDSGTYAWFVWDKTGKQIKGFDWI